MNNQQQLYNQKWFYSAKGKKLIGAKASIFIDSELSSSLEDADMNCELEGVFIEFEGLQPGLLTCDIDGTSITLDNEQLQTLELGEYGNQKVVDLSNTDFWKSLLGKRLEKIRLVESITEECVFAIEFFLEGNRKFTVANIGDSLFCLENIHPDILEQEKAVLIQI